MTSRDGALGLALFDARHVQDPYPLYAEMHRAGPVHRIGDSGFYAVSSWEAVHDAVGRCADFSSNLTATMVYDAVDGISEFPIDGLGGPTQALATADEPWHAVHRKAVLPRLTAKRIRALDPFVAETAGRLWDAHRADGNVEWMAAMANRLPMMIVCRLIGVPDRDVDRIGAWGYAATQVVEGLATDAELAQASAAVGQLGAYITTQFARAAGDPADDLLGDLARACTDGVIDVTAAQMMMITLFGAGGESTASLIGSAAWILASHRDIQDRLRAEPDLLGPFLEEVLRYEPPFRGHYRHVLRDSALGGVELPAGSRLLLLWGAANRDPAHFDRPDEFRLGRSGKADHLAFGRGVHFCVGAALARMEATVVLRQLLEKTSQVTALGTGRWLPSLLVRRLERLSLAWR
jgi:cytochrome P450 family 144